MGGTGSGGLRPNAPQNSPMNINPMGGNGQSGTQAAKYIPGLGYGQGQATMAQQQAAPMQGPSNPAPAPTASMNPTMPLTAPTTRPNEPVTAGAAMGAGPGMEALNLPPQQTGNEEIDTIIAYYPAMQFWANQVGTSQTTKDYVRYLGTLI